MLKKRRQADPERRPFRVAATSELFALADGALDADYPKAEGENEEANGIAVVTVFGPLEHHGRSWGWFDSYDAIEERVEAAFADDECAAVVFQIDSPGGVADGAFELHDKIRRLRKKYGKPLYAFAKGAASSAAYAIASSADEVWLSKSAHVGSVGVIGTLVDATAANKKAGVRIVYLTTGARKADQRPDRVLTPEIEAAQQRHIDYYGDLFFRSVGKARAMDVEAVIHLEADTFFGPEAVKAGLADGVSSWDAFLARVRASMTSGTTLKDRATPETPSTNPGKTAMKKSLLKLVAARDEAEAALLAEKSPKKRKALAKAYGAACAELAEAKSEKTVKHEEHTVDDGKGPKPAEDDEEEEDEDDDDSDDDDDDSDDDDDDDDEEEESEEEESEEEEEAKEEKKAKALASARSILAAVKGTKNKPLIAEARENLKAAKSALSATSSSVAKQVARVATAHSAKLEKRTARLEAGLAEAKVEGILERYFALGKFGKGERPALKEIGMSSRKQLRGLLDARASNGAVRTTPSRAGAPTVESQRQAMGANLRGTLADQDEETQTMIAEAADAMGVEREKFFQEMRRRPGLAAGKAVLS